MSNSNPIILFEPAHQSARIMVFIPYQMKEEREFFKRLSSAYYHPIEKLWSVLNVQGTFEELGRIYSGKCQIQKMHTQGLEFRNQQRPPTFNIKVNANFKDTDTLTNEALDVYRKTEINSLKIGASNKDIEANLEPGQNKLQVQQCPSETCETTNSVKITSTHRHIYIFIRKNETDIQFIRNIT